MTVQTIPARPTTYNGIPMRSRMEARVAAYLDALGWGWEYEPRAFAGRAGQYLPDFRIHGVYTSPFFLEVKGRHPTLDEFAALFDRMRIIHASEPAAFLGVVSDRMLAIGWFALSSPSGAVFEAHATRCPDHPSRILFSPILNDEMEPWCPECDPERKIRLHWSQCHDYFVGESDVPAAHDVDIPRLIEESVRRHGVVTVAQRVRVAHEVLPHLRRVASPVLRDRWVHLLSRRAGVDERVLSEAIR